MKTTNYKGKVLIIDDTVSIIDMVKTALLEKNYQVLIATTVTKGITSAKKGLPDLILLNIQMPEMDGYETCRQLKSDKQTKEIPVLIMSALSEVFDKIKAFNVGAADYIPKPLIVAELLARVDTQVTLYQTQQQLKDTNLLFEQKVENRIQALKQSNEEIQAAEKKLKIKNKELGKRNSLLRETEEKLQSIFRVAPTGIGLIQDRVITEINEEVCNISGYSNAELIGKSSRILYPSDEEFNFVGREKYKQISERGTGELETKWETKNGEIKNILLASTPIHFEDISQGVTFTASDITEQRKAQKALAESENRFRTIIESANDAIIIAEAKSGIIVDANKKASELTGLLKDEIIGMHQTQLHPVDDREVTKNDFKRTVKNGNFGINEFRVMHSSGEIIPVEINPALIKLNNEEFLVGFFRDIRTRKEAEKALAESYIKYKMLAEYTYDWEYWKAPDGSYIYNSPSCKRITEYSLSEFDEEVNLFNSIIFREDKEKWQGHLQKVEELVACKTPMELRIKTKSGQIKWINHICQPVFDDKGNFIGNRGTNRDITQRKLSELALIDSESRFKQLANFTQEGILIHQKGIIHDVNKSIIKISGYSKNELLSSNLLKLFIQKKDHSLVAKKMLQQTIKNYEIDVTIKGGKMIPVEISAHEMLQNNESVRFISVRDISEQKQMQQKILNAIIQTEENERLRVAQELHDGIGPILSTVKLYTQTYINSKNIAFKQKIENHLITGIDDALAQVSSISNNLSPHVLKDFGLEIAIQKFIRRLQKVNSIIIHFNFNSDYELTKEIETTLYRVAIELINNTIKHAKATEMSLHFEKINEFVQFIFTDNGIGFELENTKKMGGGMGLFNIINRIEAFNGRVTFEKGVENGIAFNILIPTNS